MRRGTGLAITVAGAMGGTQSAWGAYLMLREGMMSLAADGTTRAVFMALVFGVLSSLVILVLMFANKSLRES